MQQIVDLQEDPAFQNLDVALVSIATDSEAELASVAREWKIATPLLSDRDRRVSEAYGVLQWATQSGEPGHTFVLVDTTGTVRWIQDYGAAENGGLMYVPVDDLITVLRQRLPPAELNRNGPLENGSSHARRRVVTHTMKS